MTTVGIVASPSAGKDLRRLVANAGSVGDVDKISIIRRAASGAIEGGATRLLYLDDNRHLVERALEGLISHHQTPVHLERIDIPTLGSSRDSVRAAEELAKQQVSAVLVFGGDGTNRDIAKGWEDAPVVPISVGTNNVFPLNIEPTLGGVAAGLVAKGVVELEKVAQRAKVIHVHFDDREDDRALVDVVLTDGDFIGARAIWNTDDLRSAVFAIAEPASVGLSSIGATLENISRSKDAGLFVEMGESEETVRAPIAPGTYETIGIIAHRVISLDEQVIVEGPGVLAFDGERDHVLTDGQTANLSIRKDGPWVIDPTKTVELANEIKYFQRKL
tara:strand:+ start:3857 stop:4852 length:996 start_codon:yes stop_codon:yes gene_type:complete